MSNSKKKTITGDNKVVVVKFNCPNCGATRQRVFYCNECDSPMEVEETYEVEEQKVEDDIAISKEVLSSNDLNDNNSLGKDTEENEMDKLMEEGLGDIYPDDGSSGNTNSDMDLTDVLDALDNE